MWELDHKEGWAPKNWMLSNYVMVANAFEFVVLKKTLESPLDCKEIQPVSPKRNQPWIFIERINDIAKASILWPSMQRPDSLEKTLVLGKIEGKRRSGWQRMRWLDSITNSVDENLSKLRKRVKDKGDWHTAVHGVAKSETQLSSWTTTWKCWLTYRSNPFHNIFMYQSSVVHLKVTCYVWIISHKVGKCTKRSSRPR